MDIEYEIKRAMTTGKVAIGLKKTKKYLNQNLVKFVIYSNNSPYNDIAEKYNVPAYRFNGSNIVLGVVCGKPFGVSTLCIIEPGESEILRIEKMLKENK